MGNQVSGTVKAEAQALLASEISGGGTLCGVGLPSGAASYLPAMVDVDAAARRIEYSLSADQKAAFGACERC